jgi:hypothetical protein
MFTAVFAGIAKLFGSKAAGEAIIDGVTSGIDKMWHTDEEKSDDAAQARREGMTAYMAWLESTTGSRIIRRIIASTVTGIWALEHIMAVILETAAVFANDTGAVTAIKLTTAGNNLASHANDNAGLVGAVLLFYFGGPVAIDASKGLIEKWANKTPKTAGQ